MSIMEDNDKCKNINGHEFRFKYHGKGNGLDLYYCVFCLEIYEEATNDVPLYALDDGEVETVI